MGRFSPRSRPFFFKILSHACYLYFGKQIFHNFVFLVYKLQSPLLQDEWTGEQKIQYSDVPDDIEPEEIRPMGNYAVSITWPDGFSQVI